MTETLPSELAGAQPRHCHVYRTLKHDLEGWTATDVIALETKYPRGTVQEVCADLAAENLVDWRHNPRNAREKLYRI